MKVSVGAIIYRDGKYLLQKRDNKINKIFFPGYWGLFGGSVDKKERTNVAILRELKEELSLKLRVNKKIISLKFQSDQFKQPRKRIYYFCNLEKKQKKKIKLNEGQGYKFLEINKIAKLKMVPWDLLAIQYFHITEVMKKKIIPKHIND